MAALSREEEIAEFCETLRRAWSTYPHLRFGQILSNSWVQGGSFDLFNVSDERLEAVLAAYGNVLPSSVRVTLRGKLADRIKAGERELGRKLTPFELESLQCDVERRWQTEHDGQGEDQAREGS